MMRRVAGALVAILIVSQGLAACASAALPTAPADLLEIRPANTLVYVEGQRSLRAEDARLVGPSFSVQFTSVGFAPILAWPGQDVQAAEGHEFVLLMTPLARSGTREVFPDGAVSAQLVVNGVVRPLPKVPRSLDSLVASVPVNSSVGLQVIDQGRAQTFDLRTGRRGPDAIKLYYPVKSQELTGKPQKSGGVVSISGFTYPFEVTFQGFFSAQGRPPVASLEPFSSFGWAPEGRAWLLVRGVGVTYDSVVCGCQPELDFARNVALALPDGSTARTRNEGRIPLFFGTPIGNPPVLVFDVPESFTAGTVTMSFDGPVRYRTNLATTWRVVPAPAVLSVLLA